MTQQSAETLAFLLSRRSRPAKTLRAPGPDRGALETILTAAARTPDHGKLEPWRFLVLEGDALTRLHALTLARGEERGEDPEKLAKAAAAWIGAPACIAIVASPKPSEKIPEVEQTLSAGAVCLAALNAGLAMGWGANWLSGWVSRDRPFLTEGLGLLPHEWVAGFIHIGTESGPPPERPRPDLDHIVRWIDR